MVAKNDAAAKDNAGEEVVGFIHVDHWMTPRHLKGVFGPRIMQILVESYRLANEQVAVTFKPGTSADKAEGFMLGLSSVSGFCMLRDD